MKILMVCLGNICRSPLAEGILQQKSDDLHLGWQVESAGTNGYHVGQPPHRLSQKVAGLNGVDISHQCARNFEAADFDRFDKIFAMAQDVITEMQQIAGASFQPEKVDLIMNEIFPDEDLDVPDPWYGTEPGYHEVFSMLNQACTAIIKKYQETGSLA